MKKIILCLILCSCIIHFFSCVASKTLQKDTIDNDIKNKAEKKIEILPQICNELQLAVAKQFYDFDKKRTMRVHICKVSSNYFDEPYLSDYLYGYIKSGFEQLHQFIVTSSGDPALDCIIDVHVIKGYHGDFEILSNVIDANNTIICSIKKECTLDSSDFQEYLANKGDHRIKEVKKAHLLVKAINKGSTYQEKDNYYRHTYRYGSYYKYSRESLYSGYYPAEQKCIINGKTYPMKEEDVFYNDIISSGSAEIIASCRAGSWDAIKSKQQIGKKISKKFYLNINKNDDISVNIIFIFDGDRHDIKVEAFKKKQFRIKRHGAIKTSYEAIDVLSK